MDKRGTTVVALRRVNGFLDQSAGMYTVATIGSRVSLRPSLCRSRRVSCGFHQGGPGTGLHYVGDAQPKSRGGSIVRIMQIDWAES